MTTDELTAWKTDVMDAFADVETVADVTAGNFAKDLDKMADAAELMDKDMQQIAQADWVPDAFLKFLLDQGPAAIHDFAEAGRAGREAMVADWKRLGDATGGLQTTLDDLTAAVNDLANAIRGIPSKKRIDIFVVRHRYSDGELIGGPTVGTGGIVKAAHGMITQGPTVLAGEGSYSTFAGRGAEAVIPLNGRGLDILSEAMRRAEGKMAKNGDGTITINIDRRRPAEELSRYDRFGGRR